MDRMEGEEGVAEVHTHIGLGPNQPAEPLDGLEELSRGGSGASGRARDFASQARSRAADALDRASSEFEERTGLFRVLRDHPLAAVGVAFAVGFLAAGRSDSAGRYGKAKQQLRGAIIGAISAAVAQETRNMAGIFGGDDEEYEEELPPRRPRRPRRSGGL